jgi:hypothetical protein
LRAARRNFGQVADFDGFPGLVTAVIDGIDDSFFQGRAVRVEEADGLASVATFVDALLDDGVAQVRA